MGWCRSEWGEESLTVGKEGVEEGDDGPPRRKAPVPSLCRVERGRVGERSVRDEEGKGVVEGPTTSRGRRDSANGLRWGRRIPRRPGRKGDGSGALEGPSDAEGTGKGMECENPEG